ncbi:MAG: RNA ligase family protein [Melioribacteraceae bacterium]
MRHLATIQRIANIEPIEGADKIEKATILGWELVVKKGEFNVGDFCCYFEIDSQLPRHLIFEFMQPRKYRVRTIKLRKQISQGLALPVSILQEFGYKEHFVEGTDISEIIGVTKYDPEMKIEKESNEPKYNNKFVKFGMQFWLFRKGYMFLFPKLKGNFPEWIPKTDEERIQNMPWISRKYHGHAFYATEKLDGQSLTIFYNKKLNKWWRPWIRNAFGVCSRNLWIKNENNSTWWTIAKRYEFKKKLKNLNLNIAIQGEIVGEGIQKNKYKLEGIEFFAFSVYDIDEKRYLSKREKAEVFIHLGLKEVPHHSLLMMDGDAHDVRHFVNLSKMKSALNEEAIAEGLVFRHITEDKISFKSINPEFLLKNDE